MRWPWTLIAVPLAVACALSLGGCSSSGGGPTAYDCAEWKALSPTARSAAVGKLVAANYPESERQNDRYKQINNRLERLIKMMCAESETLVPAEKAVEYEQARQDPELDEKGQPTMRSAEERRRCPDQWSKFVGSNVDFAGCTKSAECAYHEEEARIIEKQFRYYHCYSRCPPPLAHEQKWGKYNLVPIPSGVETHDNTSTQRFVDDQGDPRVAEFDACRESPQCPEGRKVVVLSEEKQTFRCEEPEQEPEPKQQECDPPAWRTNHCVSLVDKSPDAGIQDMYTEPVCGGTEWAETEELETGRLVFVSCRPSRRCSAGAAAVVLDERGRIYVCTRPVP